MALSPGTRFGPYEVVAAIGAGGMGEVYRATDVNLKRDVALKVLPEAFAANADRVARFQREAEMLAALNHPNIAQIYGLEKGDGATALVMELVEGPTLADRIAEAPIPPDEALAIAYQIADALEAAHARGIVHRDLKPANVKLRADGAIKVLDFGIAKALETRVMSGPSVAALTTPAMTQAGLLLGTAAYMAPEQARGKAIDQRADIWAFGCVLYEMLTGQPAFGGEDVLVTLARVLDRDTDMSSLPGAVSPAVRHTLKLCLEKDVNKRIADIRDVKLAFAGAFEGAFAVPRGAEAQPRARRAVPLLATAIAAAVLAVVGTWLLKPAAPVPARPVNRFVHPLPADLAIRNNGRNVFAFSPDGRRFVYNTIGGLYLRDLGELEARPIPGTEGQLAGPFFSPDGQALAYAAFTGGDNPVELRRLSISGGASVVVARLEDNLDGAQWGPDGTILFGQSRGIFAVAASGCRTAIP